MKPVIGSVPSPALVALADSTRRLADQLLRVDREDPELDRIRRSLDGLRERLAAIGSDADRPRVLPDHPPPEDGPTRPYYFPGALEPRVHVAAPWMTAERDGARRRGKLRFDLIHEGPPGTAHGGFVAWTFDQVFGQHVVESALGGPTHRLEVVYRRPTPILRELDYAVEVDRRDGRKLFLRGELRDGDTLTAEASALFVRPRDVPEDEAMGPRTRASAAADAEPGAEPGEA